MVLLSNEIWILIENLSTTIATTPNYTLYYSWERKSGCGCHRCTFSILTLKKLEPMKVNYNHQPSTTEMVVVCKLTLSLTAHMLIT